MRPKTGTVMANRKKLRSFFCFIFLEFFLGLTQFKENYRKISFSRTFVRYNAFVDPIFDPENHPLLDWCCILWTAGY